jgi:hypothetical protein
MVPLLQHPFVLLFCATTGVAALLAHRLFVREIKPGFGDKLLALGAAVLSLGLSFVAYQIREGGFGSGRIDAGAAAIVAALTGLGVAFVCLECVLGGKEATE